MARLRIPGANRSSTTRGTRLGEKVPSRRGSTARTSVSPDHPVERSGSCASYSPSSRFGYKRSWRSSCGSSLTTLVSPSPCCEPSWAPFPILVLELHRRGASAATAGTAPSIGFPDRVPQAAAIAARRITAREPATPLLRRTTTSHASPVLYARRFALRPDRLVTVRGETARLGNMDHDARRGDL